MRNRSVVVALVVALLATAGWWFGLYSPQNQRLAQVQTEIDGLIAQQQGLRNDITELRQVQADEAQIRAALTRLEDYIPSGVEESRVIRQLQASADAAGVDITSMTFAQPAALVDAPPAPTPDVTLAEIPVTMVMEGGYFQVVDFFRRLEVDLPRALLVNSITLAEGADGFPQLSTTWAGDVFAEVPVVPVPPPAAPADGAPAEAGATDTQPQQAATSTGGAA